VSDWQAAAALLAFLVAASLKGITGLGFSTICLALLGGLLDLRIAIPLVLLPSLASNLLVMWQAGGLREALVRFWPMYLASLPGLVGGVYVLESADGALTRAALGLVLMLYAAWALLWRTAPVPARTERWLRAPVGLATGLVNGVTGSQVVPVLPFLLSLDLRKDAFVQAINVSFTLGSLTMLGMLGNFGRLAPQLLLIGVLGVVPVALGIRLGGAVRTRLPETGFRRAVLLFLLLMGAGLVARLLL